MKDPRVGYPTFFDYISLRYLCLTFTSFNLKSCCSTFTIILTLKYFNLAYSSIYS